MARTARRRYACYVKGARRIKIDRAQHGGRQTWPSRFNPEESTPLCPCFSPTADKGRGKEFARFADTPCPISEPKYDWKRPVDLRAPRPEEWD